MAEDIGSNEQPPQDNAPGISFEQAVTSTERAWQERLQRSHFTGDIERAAHIMRRVADGAQWLYDKKKEQGKISPDTRLPRIDVDPTTIPKFGGGYFRDHHTIILGTNTLELLASVPPDTLIEILRKDGVVGYRGTPDEFGFLFGVEELDHALTTGENSALQPLLPNQVPLHEYNAQEHEYSSLFWRIRAAQEHKFHRETIDFLKGLQFDAYIYRSKKIGNK